MAIIYAKKINNYKAARKFSFVEAKVQFGRNKNRS
jgi:hypothetical protein